MKKTRYTILLIISLLLMSLLTACGGEQTPAQTSEFPTPTPTPTPTPEPLIPFVGPSRCNCCQTWKQDQSHMTGPVLVGLCN